MALLLNVFFTDLRYYFITNPLFRNRLDDIWAGQQGDL